MSFSFVEGSAVRGLRVVIGDRWEAGHLVEDEELAGLLPAHDPESIDGVAAAVRGAAVPALELAIAAAGTKVTFASGEERAEWSGLAEQLRRRRDDLLAQGYPSGRRRSSGGVRRHERDGVAAVPDWEW